jgi:uncharacterized protein affecting Mg2+/Co2+ transport
MAGVSKCQLVSREWRIQRHGAEEEVVRGPGVIGQYPVVQENSQFVYESCNIFEDEQEGSMEGSFRFKLLDGTNEEFDVQIPKFVFRPPPRLTL